MSAPGASAAEVSEGEAWEEGPPAAWTVGVPLPDARVADGTVELPAGVALLLGVTPAGAPVSVRDVDGDPVRLLGAPAGYLVPAAGARRALVVTPAPGATVRVHRSDAPGTDAAWDAWERAALRALRRGEPLPAAPWGGARLAASVTLRAAAVEDPAVVHLGLVSDVERLRPLRGAAHVGAGEAPLVAGAPVVIEGPGTAVVRASIPAGPLARFGVRVVLDGGAPRVTPVASTGAAPVAVRVWIPPGPHTLAVDVPERADVALTVEHAALKPRLFGPALRAAATTGVAEAERLWILGDVAGARAAFVPFRDAPGAAGALARARLLATATDPAEARALARFGAAAAAEDPAAVPDAVAAGDPVAAAAEEVLADAILGAADLLPDAVVLDAARRARDPDLDALAAWLDRTGGVRPRGVALLTAAGPDVPLGPTPATRAIRLAGLDTRWTRLAPVAAAGPVAARVTPAGPGVPRVEAGPGETVTVTLPPVAAGRVPVLRLEAAEASRLTVDGAPWTAAAGPLDVALPAGPHTIAVEAGRVRVLDADLVTGGTRVYAWEAAPLPATWEIPDPGVGVDLAAAVEGPSSRESGGVAGGDPPPPEETSEPRDDEAWVAVFDDGATVRFSPAADGAPVRLRAGPYARAVTMYGPAGARAGLAVRAVHPPAAAAPAPAAADEAAALAEIERLSRAVDAGDPAARAARARLLGQLGQVGAARRDLAVLLADGEVVTGRALAAAIVPDVPSAAAVGPRSVGAALAAAGYTGEAPTDAAALERLAGELDQPWLFAAAAEMWLATGDAARALSSARAAGPAGADVEDRVSARLRFVPVSYADASAGLVTTDRRAEDPAHAPRWWRVREAMLALPWPVEEGVVVRAPGTDLVRAEGARIEASLFCRDEGRGGRPCVVPARLDGARRAVEIADGTAVPLAWEVAPGPHEVEIGPVAEGFAVGVRVTVDGALLPPAASTTAIRAAPGRPIVLTVATPAVLRATVVRGRARVGGIEAGVEAADGDPPVLMPLAGEGAARVEIAGDADVLLAVGTLGAAAPEPAVPVVPPPAARVPIAEVAPVLAKGAARGAPARVVPGDTGTWAFSLSALHQPLKAPVEPWDATQAETAWTRAHPRGWLAAEAWMRGPSWAGGAEGEVGWTFPWGYGAVGARGGVGTGLVDAAGGAAIAGRARRTFAVGAIHRLHVEGKGRAGWASPDPIAPVDPRAWTGWAARHPVWIGAEAGWSAAPFRDARLDAAIGATSNTGPSLDHVYAEVGADLLLGSLALAPTATFRWRFADADRAEAGLWTDLRLRADWTRWGRGTTRVRLWGEGGLVQGAALAQIGVTVLATDGRGLYDLPPGAEPWRDARGPFAEGEW